MILVCGAAVGLCSASDRPVDPLMAEAPPLVVAAVPEGHELAGKVIPVEKPEDETFFKDYTSALQQALPKASEALVCIQAGGGSGSGTIVTETGLILTAAHVVATPGTKLTIVMPDGTEHDGEALGVDAATDAGMARIINPDGIKFPTAPLGDYGSLNVGDWVFAMGHSGGWDEKRGPVVRMGRIVLMEETTVQSDCVLIGGDSGGPLFDLYGRLIGINSRVGMNVEFSMHVPVSVLLADDEAYRSGAVNREEPGGGILGVVLDEDEGVKVKEVIGDAPADIAGLVSGDVILRVDGEEVTSADDVRERLAGRYVGERVLLGLSREGDVTEDVWVRLMMAPPQQETDAENDPGGGGESDEAGGDEAPEGEEEQATEKEVE